MPGIVGYIGQIDSADPEKLLQVMACALESESRFKTDLYHEAGLGLGRVSLGVVNPERQPVWNAEHTRCIVMEGELYDSDHLKREMIKRGYRFFEDNDAELILLLFEEYGDEFAIKLNGAYIAAIWDEVDKQLVIVNDRLGLFPLYYSRNNDNLIFASGVRALLAVPSQNHTIDRAAIAEFLTFDHLLDDRTLVEEIRLLPQASILKFSDHHLQICPYWTPQYPEQYPLCSEFELIEELQMLIRQAVERQSQGNVGAGILLSGGLDSRILLAYLAEIYGHKIHSFTWGIPGCDDARYAAELSRRAHVPHHFFELKPDWMLEKAECAIRMTDGMGNIVNLHALATLDAETKYAKVIYKGFLGDAMMGYGLRHQFWGNYDWQTEKLAHLNVHMDQGLISISPEVQNLLFTDCFKNDVGTLVLDTYNADMDAANIRSLADQRNFFDFRQRVPRMTIKGVEVVRSRAAVRLPFCDNDLVEFSLTIPPGLRYNRRLVKDAFVREFPHLAQVPITETGYPMMICTRDVILRASQVVRYRLRRSGFGWMVRPEKHRYQNYEHYFRTGLRSWLEDILLSKQALERGYFNPGYLQKIIAEHMSGVNHTVAIGALLSLELWHRIYVD